MYVLSSWTVSALTGVLFLCLFPSNKHKNNPHMNVETVPHSSTYIILYFFTWYQGWRRYLKVNMPLSVWVGSINPSMAWVTPSTCVSSHREAPHCLHYNDVIMGAIASQITSLTIVYSTVYSETDQRKHQSSASLAFVQGIPVNSLHKWPATWKMFPFDDAIMSPCGKLMYGQHQTQHWLIGDQSHGKHYPLSREYTKGLFYDSDWLSQFWC